MRAARASGTYYISKGITETKKSTPVLTTVSTPLLRPPGFGRECRFSVRLIHFRFIARLRHDHVRRWIGKGSLRYTLHVAFGNLIDIDGHDVLSIATICLYEVCPVVANSGLFSP